MKNWKMPEWMEKYREDFTNTGGNTVEELMNTTATLDNNTVVVLLSVAQSAQVGLLQRLHEKGLV